MNDPEERTWKLVQAAILAFNAKVPDITQARAALRDVISTGAWRRYQPPLGEPCDYEDFGEWVTTKVPRGLGTTVGNLKLIAAGDERLMNELDKVLQNPVGTNVAVDNIHSLPRSTGTSQQAALRRLREHRPDLHAHVLAGRMSAHAAMVTAGFRPRTVTVPVTRPESVAAALRRHMTPADLAALIQALTREGAIP